MSYCLRSYHKITPMPMFGGNPAQSFVPKTVKFEQLYKTASKGQKLGASVLGQTKTALSKAGYEDKKISEIITKNTAVSIKDMKKVAEALNNAGVYGFKQSPTATINQYVAKERVKAQSIARIRKEHIKEAYNEAYGGGANKNQARTSLTSSGSTKTSSLTGPKTSTGPLGGGGGRGGMRPGF